jgi:protein-arginine kinase activator protein McsA
MAYVKDEMAVRQNDEQTTNATQQAGKTTCGSAKRTGRTEQKTAAPQEAAGGEKQTGKTSGSPKRQRRGKKRGIDRLKEAVNKVVSRECAELAASLLNGAKDGNVTSAKLLVLLAESVKPPERRGNHP